MTSTTPPAIASAAESLIPQFKLTRLLSSDQAGRRISLLGTIASQPALLIAERAAFSTSTPTLSAFPTSLRNIKNLGVNDIYAWFLANSNPDLTGEDAPDFKINLIYPCTNKHVKKYTAQRLRVVTETPAIYTDYVKPYMAAQRAKGSLNWVYNILDGITEQEDVVYRESSPDTGFLLLPDLNWDRVTQGSLHLLGLVERRDIWSVRDLTKGMVGWLRHVVGKMLDAVVQVYGVERDEVKMYVHCKFPWILYRRFGKGNDGSEVEANGSRSADVLSLPHPHRTCLARGWEHASHGQGTGAGECDLAAGDHGGWG
jgi:m7GpppX diphosphatase